MTERPRTPKERKRKLESLIGLKARDLGITVGRYRDSLNRRLLLTVLQKAYEAGLLETYHVKGGAAIELRFGLLARATRDIDIELPAPLERLPDLLAYAIALGCGGFAFELKKERRPVRNDAIGVVVAISYLGLAWGSIDVDLAPAAADDLGEPLELPTEDLLDLAGTALTMRLERIIAQKIHAATCPDEPDYEFDYARHVVDVLFLSQTGEVDFDVLRVECERVFLERAKGGRTWPPSYNLPERWIADYGATLKEYKMDLQPGNVPAAFSRLIARILGVVPDMI